MIPHATGTGILSCNWTKRRVRCCRQTAKAAEEEPTVDALDIRVGRIVKVDQHPNAESLYVEDIDLGEEKPRQVGNHK